MRKLVGLGFTALLLLPVAVIAAETVTNTYDARGRLVKVVRSGSANDGIMTDYEYDKADNRTKVKTTGSVNQPS